MQMNRTELPRRLTGKLFTGGNGPIHHSGAAPTRLPNGGLPSRLSGGLPGGLAGGLPGWLPGGLSGGPVGEPKNLSHSLR